MAKRDLVLNNFWWKLIALFLAVAAWVGFKSREKDGMRLWPDTPTSHSRLLVSHPISITKPANDSREFRVQPTTVDITLTGEADSLRELETREVRATVEITSDLRRETNTLPIHVFLPQDVKNIQLEKWAPDKVQVELVKPESKL
jgi:hypothetical protein